MEDRLEQLLKGSRMIPSVASVKQLKYAVEQENYPCIMLKMGDISTIRKITAYIHQSGKKLMLHIDSVKGVAKDEEGFRFLKNIGVDSIITMKSQYIRLIKEKGMYAILGTFLVDSSSVMQTLQNIRSNKPDAIVVMPMTIPDETYGWLKENVSLPILAGGLGVNYEIICHVLKQGVKACAVTDQNILDQWSKMQGDGEQHT